MTRRFWAAVLASALASMGLAAPVASAGVSCIYDDIAHTVVLAMIDGQSVALSVGGSGEIEVDGVPCSTATTANIDTITVTGSAGANTLIVDLGSGPFAPGFTAEAGASEIEIVANLAGGGDALTVKGTTGHDQYTAGANGLNLNADADGDDITSGDVQLTLQGLGGDDTLSGGGGDNTGAALGAGLTLEGGDASDRLMGGNGNDAFDGQGGVDTADFSKATAAVTASLAAGTASGQGADTLAQIEQLVGSSHDDSLTGNGGDNTVSGGPGRDTLRGGPGNDTIQGGIGVDAVVYAAAVKPMVVSLLAGTATGQGTDTLSGVETVVGSARADALRGSNGRDTLRGGAGPDTLTGLRGNDTLVGGPGVDTVNYGAAGGVQVNLGKGRATGEGIDVLAQIENVVGDSARDVLIGNRGANRLEGNSGNDVLRGGGGNDLLLGLGGLDALFGGPGRDRLHGGLANDSLDGGLNVDSCFQDQGRGRRRSCERP